jgi:RNase H-fold protein (predicted Holliday junction resolvase)
MKILGIDYGRSKIGLAVAESSLAEPWKVVAPGEIENILKSEKFDKVVVGISEGEMGAESKKFAESIGAETFDETLTSQDAQRMSREAGIPVKKRHEMEDAYAASIMLQNFLDFSG